MNKGMRILGIVWGVLNTVATMGLGATIPIQADGSGAYPTIQAAIDAADNGDAIVLSAGTYTGAGNRDIDFKGKAITIRSQTGPKHCILDCESGQGDIPHRGFYFHTAETHLSILDGCTILNGRHEIGGGILCEQSSPLIQNCILSDNTATGGDWITVGDRPMAGGGGICLLNSEALVVGCTITRNRTGARGPVGAFEARDGLYGGGIYVGGFSGHPEIRNCIITGNRTGSGQCLSEEGGDLNPYGDGGHGGGLFSWGATTLVNCTIAGNRAGKAGTWMLGIESGGIDGSGGGLCATSETTVINSILHHNSEPEVSGIPNSGGSGAAGFSGSSIYSCIPCSGSGNLSTDPLFADPGHWDAGANADDSEDDLWVRGDYHLRSEAGRWDPAKNDWVYDETTSPAIDAGVPGMELLEEPVSPFNCRIDMGFYGGTQEASKSPVNWSFLADLTNNHQVELSDLFLLAAEWPVVQPPSKYGPLADLDKDKRVAMDDFGVMSGQWQLPSRTTESIPSLKPSPMSSYYIPPESPPVPNSPDYSLPLSISNIYNFEDCKYFFPTLDLLTTTIEQNGFGILTDFVMPSIMISPPSDIRHGFAKMYEHLRRHYQYLFITSDTLLHMYHVQFDETLKEIEETQFLPDISALTSAFLGQSLSHYSEFEGDLRDAAKRNIAFFSVAQRLLDPQATIPEPVQSIVQEELNLIAGLGGFHESPLFIYKEDYSQYKPRGHYTRSEALKRYFKAMMWYGRMAFLIKGSPYWGDDGEALISPYDAKIQTLQASLIAEAMPQLPVNQQTAREVWDRMYSITSFYVGLADDLTPYEYQNVLHAMFGTRIDLPQFSEESAYAELKIKLAALRSPLIYGGTGDAYVFGTGQTELNQLLLKTKGLRFMGQRFIPDSYMFQELVFPPIGPYTGTGNPAPFSLGHTGLYPGRCFPLGLDVMALLGSNQARTILQESGETDYSEYWNQFNKLKMLFDAFDEESWNRNLYWSWLYSLQSLITEFPQGYPGFMRTDAWQHKELNATLASWTELRHDTILYAKQSYTPVGKGSVPPPPNATGYVEAVPEFYRRLYALTDMTVRGLMDLNAISETAQTRLEAMKAMLQRLAVIAEKELRGESLASDDYTYIGNFAAELEKALTGVSNTGVRTLMVADVHTSRQGSSLVFVEEGVGYVDLIFVACPLPNGSTIMAIGPVLSYYEFKQVNNRLTDEEWITLLGSSSKPARPKWIQHLMD